MKSPREKQTHRISDPLSARRGLLWLCLGVVVLPAARAQTVVLTNPSQFSGFEKVITFDTLGTSVAVTNQFEPFNDQGVRFTVNTGGPPITVTEVNPRQFGPAGTRALANSGSPPNNVILNFNAPMNRVAFELRTLSSTDDVSLSVQCMCGGTAIGTHCINTTSTYQFVGIESAVPFDQLVIDAQGTGCAGSGTGAFRMDNLRFEGPPRCRIASPIHESATFEPCPPGFSCGTSIFDMQFLGSRFSVGQTVHVTSVGGHLSGFSFGNQMIFAAILSLAGPTALPIGNPFDSGELVAFTTFDPGRPGGDVRTPLAATLPPGDYALVFGSGLFGATGDASLEATGTPLPGNSILLWNDPGSGFEWQDIGEFGVRFVVETDTVFLEGTGATTTALIHSASSNPEPGQPITHLWTTDCPGGSFDDAASASPSLSADTSGICPDGLDCSVSLTVSDGHTSASCSAPVHFDDTTHPEISTPADVSVDCDESTDPSHTGTATATDNYDPNPAVASSDVVVSGSCPAEYTISRTWTATDACGNSATGDQVISVGDSTAPQLTVNTSALTIVDVDCSGAEAVSLPAGSATDNCDADVSVTHDAPSQFPAGQTTTVTYTASDDCGNTASATKDVSVLHNANIHVTAAIHYVGPGTFPGNGKQPLVGIEICAYDKSPGSCARVTCGGISHHHYECIATTCPSTACCTTNAAGECTLNLPPGDYVVISLDATKTVLPDPLGVSASDLNCGETMHKFLQQIVKSNGKKVPGQTTRLTGSELLIIEPEFVLWDEVDQLYPFVFESLGEWGVTVSVTPPEGFVSDYPWLSTQVNNDLTALQFTITEVGSDLVPTQTEFRVIHNGKSILVKSRIDIRLTADYAKSRGFDPNELRKQGLIKEPFPKELRSARGVTRPGR